MSTPTRAFKGVWIPVEIWDSTELSWMEKCLLAEINSLDHGDGCWASNDFLAEKFATTAGNIAKILSSLRSIGFVETVKFDGRTRWLKVNAGVTNREGQGLQNGQPCGYESGNPDGSAILGEKTGEVLDEKRASAKSPNWPAPSLEEVKAHCESSKGDLIEAEKFWHYYESNGWRVGKNQMKSWKSAYSGWVLRNKSFETTRKASPIAQRISIEKQIESIIEQIKEHPGNPEWIGYDQNKVKQQDRDDLQLVRKRLAELRKKQNTIT